MKKLHCKVSLTENGRNFFSNVFRVLKGLTILFLIGYSIYFTIYSIYDVFADKSGYVLAVRYSDVNQVVLIKEIKKDKKLKFFMHYNSDTYDPRCTFKFLQVSTIIKFNETFKTVTIDGLECTANTVEVL